MIYSLASAKLLIRANQFNLPPVKNEIGMLDDNDSNLLITKPGVCEMCGMISPRLRLPLLMGVFT